MSKIVRIPARFCGPPTSGNGGYTCGLVSAALEGAAEVTLRKPIPLECDLTVTIKSQANSTRALLKDVEELIAEGVPLDWQRETSPVFTFEEAQAAAAKSPAFENHPFPTCFTCGPERKDGDGLRIFPGRAPALDSTGSGENNRSNFYAASWLPNVAFAGSNGVIPDEIVWAALDCPTGFAGGFPYEGKLVTGRLGAHLFVPVHADEKCVLLSWQTGSEGRKRMATCVLIGDNGEVKAQSRATWIKLQ